MWESTANGAVERHSLCAGFHTRVDGNWTARVRATQTIHLPVLTDFTIEQQLFSS